VASPAPWEPAILDAASLGHDTLADIVVAINVLGNLPVWAVLVAILAAGALAQRRFAAAALIGLSFASDLAAFAVKLLVERQRPETAAEEHVLGFDSFAFPSGHVVRAVALVAVLAWLAAPAQARRARLPVAVACGVLAGLVMGYARVALNLHWPTDAIGGTLLGIGWFSLNVLVVGGTRRT
jgi:undecaprenyl-diphosphatase